MPSSSRTSIAGAVTSAALLVASLAPAPVQAQNVVVDEGTFVVFQGGRQAGTETFSIRRVGAGADTRLLASAVVELERRQMRPLLEATPTSGLSRYEVKVSGDEVAEVSVVITGNRYVAIFKTNSGEQEREFRARPGSVLLEEGVAHQYWFVAAQADDPGEGVQLVDPRGTEQPRLEVRAASAETVRIGDRSVEARRLSLSVSGVEHTLWVDREGRVLVVEVPSRGYRAERASAPA